MTIIKRPLFVVGLLITAALAIGALLLSNTGSAAAVDAPAASPPVDVITKARALESKPAVGQFQNGVYLDATAVAAEATKLETEIPLPPGATIQDAGFANSGGAPLALVTFVAQYNAMCDWYRYALDQPAAAASRQIIASIPSWSALRANPAGGVAQKVSVALQAGDLTPLKEQVRLNCSNQGPQGGQPAPQNGAPPAGG